jgi:hypothetical protein
MVPKLLFSFLMPPLELVLNSYSKNIHGSGGVKDAFY